jgi:hypothetical protein
MVERLLEPGRRILAQQVNALAAAPPKSLGNEHAADPESPPARRDEKAGQVRLELAVAEQLSETHHIPGRLSDGNHGGDSRG